jgi:hypothetical protein
VPYRHPVGLAQGQGVGDALFAFGEELGRFLEDVLSLTHGDSFYFFRALSGAITFP